MQKITPFLWFDGNAEEAINFYTSVFKDSKIGQIRTYDEKATGQKEKVITGAFTIHGQEFMVLNGGPKFKFNESISFFVNCETQEEVDYLWEKLTAGGGQESMCGWLKDKFGVSWQIIPSALGRLMGDKDPAKAGRVMQAMMKMRKIDVKILQKAYDNA